VSNTATDSAEPDIAGAQGTDQCSVKATSVKSLIVQGNETLNKIIGDMQQRITTHKEISERVRAMKEELERLREAANNIPQPATADGIAQRTLAMAAIESCTANMSGMESAVDELVATIELLKQQISEFGETDYNITDTLGIRPPAV
jgi:CII-binding regulator of phage lambda lysogenization HflD